LEWHRETLFYRWGCVCNHNILMTDDLRHTHVTLISFTFFLHFYKQRNPSKHLEPEVVTIIISFIYCQIFKY
jgi:hypothetical protein